MKTNEIKVDLKVDREELDEAIDDIKSLNTVLDDVKSGIPKIVFNGSVKNVTINYNVGKEV